MHSLAPRKWWNEWEKESTWEIPWKPHKNGIVYDLSGRVVLTLVDAQLQAGQYSANVDTAKLSPGTYFYRLTGQGVNLSRKMVLME